MSSKGIYSALSGAMATLGGKIVMFGGCSNSICSSYLNETWIWNGTTWAQQAPATSPSGRQGAAMAYGNTSTNPGVILFGGGNGVPCLSRHMKARRKRAHVIAMAVPDS